MALKLALTVHVCKNPENHTLRNLDIVYLINSPTMVYGKLDINGYGMNITCFPQNFVEIEFSSGHAEMGPGGRAGH